MSGKLRKTQNTKKCYLHLRRAGAREQYMALHELAMPEKGSNSL